MVKWQQSNVEATIVPDNVNYISHFVLTNFENQIEIN